MDGIFPRSALFEVQRRALEEAGDKQGFAFFMEQGLGKTRTVLQEFHEKVTRDLVDCLVVIPPRSLRGNWRDEVQEVGYPYPVILMSDELKALAEVKELRKRRQPFILVFHYDLVLTRGTALVKALIAMGLRIYVAIDESVRIKKHDSKVGVRLYLILHGLEQRPRPTRGFEIFRAGEDVDFIRILSGTPAPQGAHDLWSQFRVIGAWIKQQGAIIVDRTPYFAFRTLYCKMGGYMRKKIVGIKNLDILRQRTGHLVFRAKKMDWAKDLPEKLWAHPREIDLSPAQRRAYLEILNEFVLEIGPDEFITVEMAITVKNKLQQICSGWIYDNEKNVHEIVPLAENPKLNDLREFLEGIDTKVLVFYYFRPTRDYLEAMAKEMGLGYTFLESGLSDNEFDARKALFNKDDGIQVAFCQTDAVKEGHTLLGSKTRPCFSTYFLENSYSLYARLQAEDRNHRYGQFNPVTYHDVTSSREDRAIIKALQTKSDLMEALLSEFDAARKGEVNAEHE